MAVPIAQIIRLLENPRPVLEVVGQLAVDHARERFREQSFDGEPWDARYPWQKDRANFVNKAGLVADLAAGRSISPIRFEDRPAGIDRGRLRDSPGYEVRGFEAIVGVSPDMRERAQRFQDGGESSQPLTEDVKGGIAKFIKSKRGQRYADKLSPLLGQSELVTKMIGRPFIGMTDELERRIQGGVADYVEAAARAGNLDAMLAAIESVQSSAPANMLDASASELGDLFGIELE